MRYMIVRFAVHPDRLEEAQLAIRTFVEQVNREPGTLFYHSFQEIDDPVRFTHTMGFADDGAKEMHSKSAHCAAFVAKLYPLCVEEPVFYPNQLLAKA